MMIDFANGTKIAASDELIGRVMTLYERSLNLQALALARAEAGPIERWAGPRARIMAGRLANNLGGGRLGTLHHIRAYQEAPDDPEVLYYYARTVAERKGPYGAWRFVNDVGGPDESARAEVRADLLSFRATVASMLRDFGTAEPLIARAIELAPGHAWTWVERSGIYLREDRHEEALEAARRALGLREWYRPAVQTAAQILFTLNRDDEAIDLLERAAARTESGPVVAQLAVTLTERKRYDEARPLWERLVELSPLADREFKKFIAARRSDAAYFCGDYAGSAAFAKEAGKGFFEKVAARLSEDLTGKERVELPVPFVQQHHMTCAPATLSALSRFWDRPADHLEIVEEICYDGTPAHSERSWAERNGYAVREFRVTWDSAVALIDRGVPFTLTTTETISAHLQAVIGYDARRRTLILRDPGFKFSGEIIGEGLEEAYASTGPRGMALVPADRAHLLDGIELPDAWFYDQFHVVQGALAAHRRDDAAAAHAVMAGREPKHRLTLWAARSLAGYDADPVAILRTTEELIALYPKDPALQLQRLGFLRNQARRSEILAALEEVYRGPLKDAVFIFRYAVELAADPRQMPLAVKLLRKYVRYSPGDAAGYSALADAIWNERRFDEALELYRFATSLNDKEDQFASSYFAAARHLKRADEALAMLRDRFDRFAGRNAAPTRTLHRALQALERTHEAFEVLDEGLRRRPDDAELLLHAADAYARYGQRERAAELIERAKGRAHGAAYRRARATLANYRGELAAALAQWREVLAAEPLAYDAHENVAQLLAETEGREAAVAHLRDAANRFEHYFPLHQLWLNWLRGGDDLGECEAVVRRLLESRPTDAWLLRELAICLIRKGEAAEAVRVAEEARGLDASNPYAHSVAARAYGVAGRVADAAEACRAALRLSIDNDDAMAELIELSPTVAERRAALAFICDELVRQVTFGDGLLAYRRLADGTLDGEETLATLEAALAARPDLWHAWSARTRQLLDLSRFDDALANARRAVEAFPLLPRLWLDLAMVQRFGADQAGEVESLNKVLQISPGWGVAVRQLAEAHARQGEYARARELLDGAIAWFPLDPVNHGHLADVLWHLGEREAALETIRKALRLYPGYDWAWSALREWGAALAQPNAALELAREIAGKRAGEARSWVTLARMLDEGPAALDERLAALERAAALEPLNTEPYDLRAVVLARAGRWDEAVAACRPAAFPTVPTNLCGRAAWVLAQRGDVAAAIEAMNAVVADDPRYHWGWTQLAEWHREAGNNEAYRDAAAKLTWLAPFDPPTWGFLGQAQERMGDKAAAAEAYARAFELDPTYLFGGFSLFDLQLETGAFDAAAHTLTLLERHDRGSLTPARRVQYHARRGERNEAIVALKALCAHPELEPHALDGAVKVLADAGLGEGAERTMELALSSPVHAAGTSPAVAAVWVRRAMGFPSVGMPRVEKLIDAMPATAEDEHGKASPVWVRAVCTYLEELGRGKYLARVRAFAKRRMARLRADDVTWGMVGAALTDCFDYAAMITWQADWAERPGRGQWTMANQCECLHGLGRYDECAATAAEGLKLAADHTVDWLYLWRAMHDACAGRYDAADAALARVSVTTLYPQQQFLHRAVLAVIGGRTGNDGQAYAESKGAIAALLRDFPEWRKDRTQVGIVRRATRAIAKRRGGVMAWVWARTV